MQYTKPDPNDPPMTPNDPNDLNDLHLQRSRVSVSANDLRKGA